MYKKFLAKVLTGSLISVFCSSIGHSAVIQADYFACQSKDQTTRTLLTIFGKNRAYFSVNMVMDGGGILSVTSVEKNNSLTITPSPLGTIYSMGSTKESVIDSHATFYSMILPVIQVSLEPEKNPILFSTKLYRTVHESTWNGPEITGPISTTTELEMDCKVTNMGIDD